MNIGCGIPLGRVVLLGLIASLAFAQAPPAASQQAGPGGFKVGDAVKANTAFGWVDAKVLRINGNNYYVRTSTGADVWKSYPAELRRIGALTAEDRKYGVYELHDRVQVLFEGKWVDSQVVQTLGQEYQVQLPGNRVAWARPDQMRFVGAQVKPAAPKPGAPNPGAPPKAGLTSCAGKIEGRWSSGQFGNLTLVVRGGKAAFSMYGEAEELECWTGGGQIVLRNPKDATDMTLELNDDGSIDTPMGQLKKRAK